MKHTPIGLTDAVVLDLRRQTRAGTAKPARYYADKYNVSINVIANALRGRSFKHLDAIEPPVVQDIRKHDKQKEAQELAKQRVPFREIAKRLNVSKASLNRWCGEIVKTRPNPEQDAKRVKAREMSESGIPLEKIAKELKISKNTAIVWCKDIVGRRPNVMARVTPTQIEEIKRLYVEEMMSTVQIVEHTNICRSTVGRICKGLSEQREVRIKLVPPDQTKIDQARQMYLDGHTYQQIKDELKVSRNIVISWCQGLTPQRDKTKVKQHRKRMGKINQPEVSGEHPYTDHYLFIYQPKTKGYPIVRLVHKETGVRTTLSLARYRMSVKEGRVLEKNEKVAHRDGPSDDIDNLMIVRTGETWAHRHKKEKRKVQCHQCKEDFVPPNGKYKQQFCSVTCRGKARSAQPRRPLPEFTRECVICEEKFQTKNPRAEVCRSQECKDIIAAHD